MNNDDREELTDIAFTLMILMWTLWTADLGLNNYFFKKNILNEDLNFAHEVCSKEFLIAREIETISPDLDPEMILLDDGSCSLFFSVDDSSISFVYDLYSELIYIHTYFFGHGFLDTDSKSGSIQHIYINHVHIEREYHGDGDTLISIRDFLSISNSISTEAGVRDYIEKVLLPMVDNGQRI